MRCTSASRQTATARDGRWPGKAACVAPLASAERRRWPSVSATHRIRHGALCELNGSALDASRVRRLLAVAVLGLSRASCGWHGCCGDHTARCVASDRRSGSSILRCRVIRRQPADLRLGGGCGGRRARASVHALWLARSCQGALAGDSCGRSALVAAASDAAPEHGSGTGRSARFQHRQLRSGTSEALRRFRLRRAVGVRRERRGQSARRLSIGAEGFDRRAVCGCAPVRGASCAGAQSADATRLARGSIPRRVDRSDAADQPWSRPMAIGRILGVTRSVGGSSDGWAGCTRAEGVRARLWPSSVMVTLVI